MNRTFLPKPSGKLLAPAVFMLSFFLGFEAGGFQFSLVAISESFHLNSVQMGGLVSSQYLAITVAPLIFGRLADRLGKKNIILVFGVLFALGCFMASVSPSVVLFAVSVFITGAGYSVCEGVGASALADACPEQSTKYINIAQCFFSAGAVVGPLAASYIIFNLNTGWRMVFVIPAFAYLVLAALLLFAEFKRVSYDNATGSSLHPRDKKLTIVIFIILATAILIYISLEVGAAFYINSLFINQFNETKSGAYAISLFWLATVPSRFLGGLLYKHQRKVVISGFAASSAAIAVLAFSPSVWVNLLCCCVLGFASGPIWPTLVSMAVQECPDKSGTATSIMQATSGAGGFLIPVLMGWLADVSELRFSFLLLAFASAIGAIIVFLITSTKNKIKKGRKTC